MYDIIEIKADGTKDLAFELNPGPYEFNEAMRRLNIAARWFPSRRFELRSI